jgi:dTDP-4-dehydrorhamnose reductase
MKKKILITGITGMLGNSLYNFFYKFNEYEIYGISRNESATLPKVNFVNLKEIKENNINFDVLIHCAAEVNVNLCENDKLLAHESNVELTNSIFSNINSKKYFYISTDSVFDGIKGNYTELTLTSPINYYAETKFLGEEIVKRTTTNYYIIRTNIYGFCIPMKNSLFEWGIKELQKGNSINGYVNMFFNPMYVGQLSLLIYKMIAENIEYGIYNTAIDQFISKYEFLKKISNEFGFNSNLVTPIEYLQDNFIIYRPLNTTLDNSKIKLLLPEFDFSLDFGFKLLKSDLK